MSETLSPQINARGKLLAVSASPVRLVVGAGQAVRIDGTAESDVIYSLGGGSASYGGAGDDTYYTWDWRDVVGEASSSGTDTLVSFANRATLGANVENLIVAADGGSGTGNAGDNIVSGAAGSQRLDGGAGNDVLIGGADGDTFVFARGAGQDVVADFDPLADRLYLDPSLAQFTTAASVRAAMAQLGADVVLDLGLGELVVFRNRQVADFTAASTSSSRNSSGTRWR